MRMLMIRSKGYSKVALKRAVVLQFRTMSFTLYMFPLSLLLVAPRLSLHRLLHCGVSYTFLIAIGLESAVCGPKLE